MLLFVWSMIPMLGARVREVMGGRRRRSASRISALGAWMEGRRLHLWPFVRRVRDGCRSHVLFGLYHWHHCDL